MARNYAALPWDYLEEMELLTDAEFGRLCRALLKYSSTGEMEELSGNERVLFPRVKMQEDRFQASYEELSNSRSESGKKGAAKRWNKSETNDSKNSKAISANGKNGKAIECNGKNGNTETKTEIETNIIPSIDGNNKGASAPAGKGKQESVETGFGTALQEAFDNWLAYKRERGETYKSRGLKTLVNQIKKAAYTHGDDAVIACIEKSMANNWAGLFFDKINSSNPTPKRASGPMSARKLTPAQEEEERRAIEQNQKELMKLLGYLNAESEEKHENGIC